jgi:hypothetical protein
VATDRHWLVLEPGMQHEILVLTDDELLDLHVSADGSDAAAIRGAPIGSWVCTYEGFAVRIADGPLFGDYLVPR